MFFHHLLQNSQNLLHPEKDGFIGILCYVAQVIGIVFFSLSYLLDFVQDVFPDSRL